MKVNKYIQNSEYLVSLLSNTLLLNTSSVTHNIKMPPKALIKKFRNSTTFRIVNNYGMFST